MDDLQDELVLGVQRDVIPVIATSRISRIVFVAIFLFLSDEAPFFVVLVDLLGVGGKQPFLTFPCRGGFLGPCRNFRLAFRPF